MISTVSIRGFKSSQTKVMLFGLPVEVGSAGIYDFSLLPLSLFDVMNLCTNQQNILSVSGGLGGVVSVDINESKTTQLTNIFSAGSTQSGQILSKFDYTKNRLSVTVRTLKAFSQSRYRYKSPYSQDIETEKGAYYSKDFALVAGQYELHKGQVVYYKQLLGDVVRAFPPPVSYIGPRRKEIEHFRQIITTWGLRGVSKGILFNAQMGISNQTSDYKVRVIDSLWINVLSSNWWSQNIYAKLNLRHKFFRALVLWNLDNYSFFSWQPQRVELSARRNNLSLSLSVGQLRMGKFGLSTVQKIDFVDSAPHYLFFYQAKWLSNPSLSLNISRNVSYPSLNDLYWRPGGNIHLLPEIGREINFKSKFVFKVRGVNVLFQAEVFSANVKNWIEWKPSMYHYWTAENLSFVTNRSAILGVSFFRKGEFFNKFRLSYQYSSVEDSTGIQIIYVPRNKFLVQVTLNCCGNILDINSLYASRRYVLKHNQDLYLEPYWVWFVSLSRELEIKHAHIVVGLDVNNVFDEQYMLVINRPQPLRNFTLSVQVNFN